MTQTLLRAEFLPMHERDLDGVTALEASLQVFPWSRGNFSDSLNAGHSVWVLREGVDLARWQELSRRDPDPAREQALLEHGFIERLGNSRLRCTPSGMLILDAVVADLAC